MKLLMISVTRVVGGYGWIVLAAGACWGGSAPAPATPAPPAHVSPAPPPVDSVARDNAQPPHDVRGPVQPMKIEKMEVVAPIEDGDVNGVEGGDFGGDLNGVIAAPPPPPPPPPRAAPLNVAPTSLEANRIAGEKDIVPDDVTKTEISRSGKDRLVGSFKLCINAKGNVAAVNQLKSTGIPTYDQKIKNTIRGEWRYWPFVVNGKATPVCTAVTFVFTVPRAPQAPGSQR